MDFSKTIKNAGVAVMFVVLFIVLIAQLGDLTVVKSDTTANAAVTSGKTLLGTFVDYVEIAAIIAIFAYFIKKMASKGGMGA